jgi:outer membrane protein OmpA-like peptidoglycan-associated protein
VLKSYPDLTVEISGHTDNEGDDASNLVLSENRAKNVVDFVVSKGISKIRLTYHGFGETRPLVENTTAANKMKNRRIEFKIVTSEN